MSTIPSRWTTVCTFAIAAGLCAAAQARASAQVMSTTTYTIGVMGGLAVPLGDLANATNSGYTIGVTLGLKQAVSPLSFRAEGSFTELPFEGTSDAKHRIYGFALDGSYNLGVASESGGLYLTGGIGYYGAKETSNTFGDTNTDWNAGLNAGLGYYLPLSGFSVNFEGRYTHIFSNPSQGLLPITVGIVF